MKTKVFFTTNAGLYFCSGTSEILIDGIHDAGAAGFDGMPDEMTRQMKSAQGLFAGSGALLFTHLHPDHYDAGQVSKYLDKHPEVSLWGPDLDIRGIENIREKDENWSFACGDLEITAIRTKHSGEGFEDTPHYSFLVENKNSGEVFFAAGDALLEPELARTIRDQISSDINVFVMIYQLVEKESRAFLKTLAPSRVFLIHQPGPERSSIECAAPLKSYPALKLPGGVDIEEPEPMSWI